MSGPTNKAEAERRQRDAIAQTARNMVRQSGGRVSQEQAERETAAAVRQQERMDRNRNR